MNAMTFQRLKARLVAAIFLLALTPPLFADSLDHALQCQSFEVRRRKIVPLGNGHPQGSVTGRYHIQTYRSETPLTANNYQDFSQAITYAQKENQLVNDLTIRGALSVLDRADNKDTENTYLFLKNENKDSNVIPKSIKLILVSSLPALNISKKQDDGLGISLFSILNSFWKIHTEEDGSLCQASNCIAQKSLKKLENSFYYPFYNSKQISPDQSAVNETFDQYIKDLSQTDSNKIVPSLLFGMEVIPYEIDGSNPPQNLYGYIWCGSAGKQDAVSVSSETENSTQSKPSSTSQSSSPTTSFEPTDTPLHCEPLEITDDEASADAQNLLYRVQTYRGPQLNGNANINPDYIVDDLTERALYDYGIATAQSAAKKNSDPSQTTHVLFSSGKKSSENSDIQWDSPQLAKNVRFFTAGVLPSMTGVTRFMKTLFRNLKHFDIGLVLSNNTPCDILGCMSNAHLKLAESALYDPSYRDTWMAGSESARGSDEEISKRSYRYHISLEMRKEDVTKPDELGVIRTQKRDPLAVRNIQLKAKGQNPYEPSLGDIALIIGVEAFLDAPEATKNIPVSKSFSESGSIPANATRVQGYLRCGTAGAEIAPNG